jgi:RNA polymerase sigma-70 factor (ECF subfamily)
VCTDFELLDRWRAGEANAGNALFQRHFDAIFRFFEHKAPRVRDELIQGTFLACVRARDQFRKQSSFRTYLFTLARHELYRYFRRRRRGGGVEVDFAVTSLVDLGTSPSGRVDRDERRALLLRALCSMPLEQQLLLELHYWEDMPPAELAVVFDVAHATARTRLYRARQALRKQIEQLGARAFANGEREIPDLDAWARALRGRRAGDDHGESK